MWSREVAVGVEGDGGGLKEAVAGQGRQQGQQGRRRGQESLRD